MTCALCGGDHRGWETAICRKNRMAVNSPPPAALVVNAEADGSQQPKASRHGQYADKAKRAAYQRDWMRAKRAGG